MVGGAQDASSTRVLFLTCRAVMSDHGASVAILWFAIGDRTGVSDSLLHMHGGLAVMFLFRIVTRRSLAAWTPFLFVLAAPLLKRASDRVAHGSWRMPDTAFDIISTIFWPLVLMVGLRWRRVHPRK